MTDYAVSSGVTSTGVTVSGGDDEWFIYGTAVGFTVNNGGYEDVFGTASDTTVSSGGTEDVYSGGTAVSTTVNSGGYEEVFGTASGTTVSGGGIEGVSAGGMAISTTVDHGGGEETVFAGGTTVSTTVNSGGGEFVSSGGKATSTTLSSGGYLVVLPGGTQSGTVSSGGEVVSTGLVLYQPGSGIYLPVASDVVVGSGATEMEYVLAGGTAISTTVDGGGDEFVYSGGTIISTTLSGGTDWVLAGGMAISTTVSSAGTEYVYSGGTASGTTVNDGAELVYGGTAIGTTVNNHGYEYVYGTASGTTVSSGGIEDVTNGTASGTTVSSGGEETVFADGTTINTTVSSGGIEDVYSRGTAISTTVNNGGGEETVFAGGTTIGTTVSHGSYEDVYGTASGTTASSGGIDWVFAGGTTISTTVSRGGVEFVYSRGTTISTTVNNGGYEFVLGTASGTTVSSGGVELVYSGGTATSTTLDPGGTIDLASLGYVSGGSAGVDSHDVLTVSVGGQTYTQQLAGTYAGDQVALAEDTTGDTDITLETPTGETPCFLPGTLILTDRGELPVEHLALGDLVLTHDGGAQPITWIGIGRVLATRGRRTAATPVIVREGALADNVPHRDLHVTKGHSIFIHDVLIPVECLVNHRSIIWDDRAQEVEIYHIELGRHDVLIANGAPAESYRDDGNRWLFQNADTGWDQPPKPSYGPVLTGGTIVDDVWRRLAERADSRPGLALTDDPDLHLMVDGRRVDAVSRHGEAYIFPLPTRPTYVRVVSRSGSPAELGLVRDMRELGVAVRRVALRQGSRFCVLEAPDPRLVEGFHAFEGNNDFRWTDGDAPLPAELFMPFDGPTELVLHIGCTTQYTRFDEPVRAVAA